METIKSNILLQSSTSLYTIGESFFEISSTDSTNNHALNVIQAKMAVHGLTFFAHEQLNGKGQHGKQWKTEKRANIIQSSILDISFLSVAHQFQLIATMAVAAHEFVQKQVIDDTFIKWPNDIYWKNRKAGGILIETSSPITNSPINAWNWAVVGIGININQVIFPDNLPNPVSLKQITSKDLDTILLAKELCSFMDKWYKELQNNRFENILKHYNLHLYKKNCLVKLRNGNIAFECTIERVDEQGFLYVSGASKERFTFGEIQWIV